MQDTKIYKEIDVPHETNFTKEEMDFLKRKKAVFRMENGKPIYRMYLKYSVVEVRKTNALGLYECLVADKDGKSLSYASGNKMSVTVEKGVSRHLGQTLDDNVKQELKALMEELKHEGTVDSENA